MILIRNFKCDMQISLNLTADHISEMLESYSVVSIRQGTNANESKDYIQKNNNQIALLKELSELVLKIILLWSPNWKSSNKLYYTKQMFCVLKSIQLMSQINDLNILCGAELPTWLYRCFKEDKNHELVRLFLTSEHESCLRSILGFYEKSLTFSNKFININNDKLLHFEAQENISHQWQKILSFFKKVCKNCNLTSDLTLFNQISMIL